MKRRLRRIALSLLAGLLIGLAALAGWLGAVYGGGRPIPI